MRILITHANGFMGSHLIDLLLSESEKHYEITGLFAPRTPTLKNLRHIERLADRIKLRKATTLNPTAVKRVLLVSQPDLIFHFERFTRPGHAWDRPQEAFDLNVNATRHLLSAVAVICPKARVVVESSAAVYGFAPAQAMPLKEESPLYLNEKSGPFEWSVVCQEAIVRQFIFEHGLDIVIGRSFNLEGPRRRTTFVTSDFASQIARLELENIPNPEIKVGNLSARRDWTDVRDGVKAYWLLGQKGRKGEVYNVGSGVVKSINEILTTFISYSNLSNYRIREDSAKIRPTDIPMWQADYSKTKKETDWQPRIPFGQMMRDILEDWRRRVKENEYDV